MKTLTKATLSLLGILFTACCGSAALQTFVLNPSSQPSGMFELTAQKGADPVALSSESIVLSKAGSNSAPVAPKPSPWKLELITDANGDGKIDPGDVIRVTQDSSVSGAVDLTSGDQYDVALLEEEPAMDALHSSMTFVTWQTTWTVP
jgi:hypothetical protein